jgi:hypothetical protein
VVHQPDFESYAIWTPLMTNEPRKSGETRRPRSDRPLLLPAQVLTTGSESEQRNSQLKFVWNYAFKPNVGMHFIDACTYTFALSRYWGLPPCGLKEFVIPLGYWELAFPGA